MPIPCPSCYEEISLQDCFRDKAVEMELASTTLKCTNTGCTWEGESTHINGHMKECKYIAVVSCPNVAESVYREAMDGYLSMCLFSPFPCKWCEEIIETEKGDSDEVAKWCCTHELSYDQCKLYTNPVSEMQDTLARVEACSQQLLSLKRELDKVRSELVEKVQPVVDTIVRVESTVQQLQEGFGEMALMVQTLQATSYSGIFIWKIPEVRRRRNEAKAGKTISLYSAPFYTSHHGYKLCLRLYMDGDGSGKGTHLSFFLTIMRGEYDALLPWPFRQTVTLTLLNQDKQHDIIQSFRPEPTSSSFQRPRNEMNMASGCPKFVSQLVLDNGLYVKNDTLVLVFKVHLSGLNPAIECGYLAGQSSSDPERYHPDLDKDTSRKLKKLKCRKRGSKIAPSTTPTSHPASPVSETVPGNTSPAVVTQGQDRTPFPFTSLGGRVPGMPVQRATSSDSDGLESNDHQMSLARFGWRVPQAPIQRVQTSSDSEGTELHGDLLGSRPPVEATRILVDPVYVQRQLWMLLEESMVDPATQLPARIMELIQQLDPQSFSVPTMTPFLMRQRSIVEPPVSNVYSSSSQLAV